MGFFMKRINIFTVLLLSSLAFATFGMKKDEKKGRPPRLQISNNLRTYSCQNAFGFGGNDEHDYFDDKRTPLEEYFDDTFPPASRPSFPDLTPTDNQKPELSIAYGKPGIDKLSYIISAIKNKEPDAKIITKNVKSFKNINTTDLLCEIGQIKKNGYFIINQTEKMNMSYQHTTEAFRKIEDLIEIKRKFLKIKNIIFTINNDIKDVNKWFKIHQSMLNRKKIFKPGKDFLEQFDTIIPVPHMGTFTYEFDSNFDSSKKELTNLDCENIKHSGALKDKYDYLNYITGRDLKRDLSKNKDIDYLTDCLYFAKKMGHDTIFEKVLTAFNIRYLKKDVDQDEKIEFLKKNTCNQKMLNKKIKLKNKNFETFKFLFG